MIHIQLSPGPIEDIEGEVLVLFHFEDMPAPRGFLGRVDWFLGGRISRLISQERFSGAKGSTLLLFIGRKIRAGWVLVLGLGGRSQLEEETFCRGSLQVAEALGSLRLSQVIVAPPYETLDTLPGEAAEDFLQWILWALSEQTPAPELSLTILERDGASI